MKHWKNRIIGFNTRDFFLDTLLMSNNQRGKYIRLICLQNDDGISVHFTKADLRKAIGHRLDTKIMERLSIDENGEYYVEWLEDSINEKRTKFDNMSRGSLDGWKKRRKAMN